MEWSRSTSHRPRPVSRPSGGEKGHSSSKCHLRNHREDGTCHPSIRLTSLEVPGWRALERHEHLSAGIISDWLDLWSSTPGSPTRRVPARLRVFSSTPETRHMGSCSLGISCASSLIGLFRRTLRRVARSVGLSHSPPGTGKYTGSPAVPTPTLSGECMLRDCIAFTNVASRGLGSSRQTSLFLAPTHRRPREFDPAEGVLRITPGDLCSLPISRAIEPLENWRSGSGASLNSLARYQRLDSVPDTSSQHWIVLGRGTHAACSALLSVSTAAGKGEIGRE